MPARPRVLLAVGTLAVALSASSLTATTTPAHAASDTVEDPAGSGLSVTHSPADLSTVRAGDRVRLTFRGLEEDEYVKFVGNCPPTLPIPVEDILASQVQNACLAQFNSGIDAAIDPITGANLAVSAPANDLYPTSSGTVELDFLVGAGKSLGNIAYSVSGPNGFYEAVNSLTCSETETCVIGFSVAKDVIPGLAGPFWTDLATLKIAPAPFTRESSGCAFPDDLTLKAAGPERGRALFTGLNKAACTENPGAPPVNYIPAGETGLVTLGAGADLALAGSALLSSEDAPVSGAEQVLVPVGLTAASLGQFGGPPREDSTYAGKKAYSEEPLPPLSLTASDAARIILHDFPSGLSGPGVRPRANLLARDLKNRPGNGVLRDFDPSNVGLPLAVAPTVVYPLGADSTPATISTYLDTWVKADWTFPDQADNEKLNRVGNAVGRISAFDSLPDSGLDNDRNALPRLTSVAASTTALYNAVYLKDSYIAGLQCPTNFSDGNEVSTALIQGCLRFVVTDTVTSAEFGFVNSKIENSSLEYVAPTTASLQAATIGATTGAGGVLTLPAKDKAAYPMTFVEYAVVPKAPLLTEDCLPRAAQQERLRDFLSDAVGSGQEQLPPGMAPLTDDLKELARTAIATVGTGEVTGACAKQSPSEVPAGADDGDGVPGSVPSSATPTTPFTGLPTSGTPVAGIGSLGGGTVDVPGATEAEGEQELAVPRFAGVPVSSSRVLPLAGLALLVGAVSAAGLGAGGRAAGLLPFAGRVRRLGRRGTA